MTTPTLGSLAFGIAAPRGGASVPWGGPAVLMTTPTLASLAFAIAAPGAGAVSPLGRPGGMT